MPSAPRAHLRRILLTLAAIAGLVGAGAVVPAFADPTVSLSVQVTDAASPGDPFPGVSVMAWSPDAPAGTDPFEATTDDAGVAVFDDLQPGSLTVSIARSGYVTATRHVVLVAGTPATLSVEISPDTSSIAGTVTDEAHQPILGANIQAATLDGLWMEFSQTDGTYLVSHLGAGAYTVTVSAAGYQTQQIDVTLAVAEARTLDVTLVKQPVGTVSGTVTDPAGHPRAGVSGSVDAVVDGELLGLGMFTTAADGTYSIDVPPGSDYTIQFWQRGGPAETLFLGRARSIESAALFSVEVDQQVTGKNIVLGTGGTLTTQIFKSTPDGRIQIDPSSWPGPTVFQKVGSTWKPVDVPDAYAGDGAAGYVSVFGLPAGTYKVAFLPGDTGPRAYVPQYWTNKATLDASPAVTVTAGKVTKLLGTVLIYPKPDFDPSPASDADVEDSTGDVESVASATQGDSVTVDVGTEYAGEWVSLWAHSDPEPMSESWVRVDSKGHVTATVDYAVPAGDHRLTVQLADDTVLGFSDLHVAEAAVQKQFSKRPVPKISGIPAVGGVVTATTTAWTPSAARYTYQWKANGEDIPGATAATFVPGPALLGAKLSVAVTAHRLGIVDATTTSALSAAVKLGTLRSTLPVVIGTRKVDATLTAVPGTWTDGTGFTYQWYRDGKPIAGQVDETYVLVGADYAKRISVRVTGSATGYATLARFSSSTAAKTLAGTITPVNAVSVSAAPVVGAPASVIVDGDFAPGPVTLRYQWYLGSTAIAGATTSTYTPTATALAKTLKVRVTASRAGYAATSVTSLPSDPVGLGSFVVPAVTLPAVRVGVPVTAPVTGWSPAATSYTYVWQVNGAQVSTSSKFTPREADFGATLELAVTAHRAGYANATATSAVAVGEGPFVSAPTPAISGIAGVRRTITVITGTWAPLADLQIQWYRNGSPIPGATSYTLVLGPGDVDGRFTVTVTGSRTAYTATTKSSAAKTATGIAYPNCEALRADYPDGVRDAGVTQQKVNGVLTPFAPGHVPFESHALYLLNTGRDADKDKVACDP